MSIALDKIFRVDSFKDEELNARNNPFSAWIKTGRNGTAENSFVRVEPKPIIGNRFASDVYSANMVFGSEHYYGFRFSNNSEMSNSSLPTRLENRKLVHLVISSPLIFVAFLTLCVLLLVLFERCRIVDDKDVDIEEDEEQTIEPILIVMPPDITINEQDVAREGKICSTSHGTLSIEMPKSVCANLYNQQKQTVVPAVENEVKVKYAWDGQFV